MHVVAMKSADPSLDFVVASVDSTEPAVISIDPDGTTWAAAALSNSGRCFWIRLDDTAGTTYGTDSSGVACSGSDASAGATDPGW
jgi:hypothetical protein